MGLLHKVFGVRGRLPDELRQSVTAEGALLLDEGLKGSLTFRNYRAPGKYSSLRKVLARGSLAITATRVVAWTGLNENLDVTRDHPGWRTMKVTLDRPDRICISWDPAAFYANRSGRVEIRFTTQQAQQAAALLQA